MTHQTDFRAGLLDPDHPIPQGLLDGMRQPAGKRYAVYRNNVTASLRDAMKAAFPLVSKLIGPPNFDQLALLFVRNHPPVSPVMMFYGAEFPAFLENFQPLAHIGYLPDAARLDLELRQSYHAANIVPFEPQSFERLTPEALLDATVTLAPSSRILQSRWPIYDIWAFNQDSDTSKPRSSPQDILITRPDFDPTPHLLPLGAGFWLAQLARGATFGQAHDTALAEIPSFDLTASLSVALGTQALAKLNHKDLK